MVFSTLSCSCYIGLPRAFVASYEVEVPIDIVVIAIIIVIATFIVIVVIVIILIVVILIVTVVIVIVATTAIATAAVTDKALGNINRKSVGKVKLGDSVHEINLSMIFLSIMPVFHTEEWTSAWEMRCQRSLGLSSLL